MDDDIARSVDSALDALLQTLRLSRALVGSQRTVAMEGFDRHAGLLCAKILDLPPDQGRAVRPRLIALLAEVTSVTLLLQAAEPPGLHPRQKAAIWNPPPLIS